VTSHVVPSVTSISSHIFKARGLKFGMHNCHINGSKLAKQKGGMGIFPYCTKTNRLLNSLIELLQIIEPFEEFFY